MENYNTTQSIQLLMALLIVSSAVGLAVKLAVRWIKIPYSIALVVVGVIIGSFRLMPPVVMTPDLILLICLPALLFEAAWNLDLDALKKNWHIIFLLAGPGVILAMLIAGFALQAMTGLAWPLTMLFGAMTAATDPISVLSLFKQSGVDKRLSLIIEAESLFNDGTAVVLFHLMLGFALTYAVSGQTPVLSVASIANSFFNFVLATFGGALCGFSIGALVSHVTKYFEDHLAETTLTAICAYGSYLIADQLHVSAVIAVLTAGIIVGSQGSHKNMSETTRQAVDAFWEYAAFLVNSIVFLLIGLQMHLSLLAKYAGHIGAGIVAILIARAALIYLSGPLLEWPKSKDLPLPMTWRHMLFWGALRGSLSMALALSLPLSYSGREEIIVVTFGVTLFTLLLPGLTIEPLTEFLNLNGKKALNKQGETA